MILKYNPKYLINLLNSDYFKELLNEITPIEKQLIYYSILVKNDKIDIEDISKIMRISTEDIMNYQIYSKEVRYSELNDYIHLSNEKKQKISF